ncbi:winged helix-turn-helix domain-containing protein, partial [Leptospira sp. SA-E8]|uniref:winged helix-turn-helix domain-containing protein n=1 Tax=Leptospira sp. SA-E8 TaxID=3422259 RepID=UPI003EBD8297
MALTLNRNGEPAWMGKPLAQLPPKEKSVLILLLRHQPEPVSKEEIIRSAWPRHIGVSDESVVRCISQLRRQVPQARIETVYGFGYKLLPSARQVHAPLLEVAHAPAEVVERFMHA